jgi:hypothetical protein
MIGSKNNHNKMSNAPKNYITWVFTDHYFKNGRGILKLIGTAFGFYMAFYIPGPVIQEYNEGWIPIWPVLGVFIAAYGFLIGIILQPYGIYRKLKRMNWWDRINNDLK